ncbi:hypothetical protein KAFR_0F03970 [Kazachstania africana CBS 2517]|uniref:non-specific serine/threonine protein kinase n=1 Tax=Kazachstania africana (strain ATCC 22294 / BCRC 22015 / CBS 2517 / CECT 1963 / NBRC 1671 / NRRL Y-8276) TaxID=1071382 RepID=H2AX92_KAZAF|nr:hypothetical protein KAFR_0F03970 [Kazachstania africana CBS 2517]CCF58992.1 hypothetical protein KAFR_0F03970 [Kazachstania africana CBS 2517]
MYSKLTKIQSGSFSTVYKAWSSTLEQYVALKVIPKKKYSSEGMDNEYKIMKLLGRNHPNICSMLDFYEDDSYYVVVLEYCECGDLYDFLDIAKKQGDPYSPALIQLDFRNLINQLFSAINYAHSLGIAHRDIKPENILLTKDGNIKLADWGHATTDAKSKEYHIGTDNYRGPETFNGTESYDTIKSDYWSIGVTMLYLIFGQCPFKCAAFSNGDVSETEILGGNDRVYPRCNNFTNFLENPHGFVFTSYLAPSISIIENNDYKWSGNGKPALYVWQDLVDIYDVSQLCRIIVDTLMPIDPEDRSMVHAFDLFASVWSKSNQEQNVTKQYENNYTHLSLKNESAGTKDYPPAVCGLEQHENASPLTGSTPIEKQYNLLESRIAYS